VPVRATITSFGPVLLSKVLGLNDTQESSLGLVFHFADTAGPAAARPQGPARRHHPPHERRGQGELAPSAGCPRRRPGVLLRELIASSGRRRRLLRRAGVRHGRPAAHDPDGRGVLSVMGLAAVQDRPALFSTFLMWLLADLFGDLPEVGDVEQPKLVFFLDEAHLLFDDASEAFLDAIARTVRLIRSKGVGVFFVTQTPKDVPSEVLAQLGNRVQHALRAFTPDDAKALKATVSTFPRSEAYDVSALLTSMGTGEAAVTILSERGAPTPVVWTRLRPPASLMARSTPRSTPGSCARRRCWPSTARRSTATPPTSGCSRR
jgi:hypothetical protein